MRNWDEARIFVGNDIWQELRHQNLVEVNSKKQAIGTDQLLVSRNYD
jgi:hypothetical protein